jgi:hypothetical protein
MTRTPRRQPFAVMLSRFFVVVEDARIAAIATAVARIGFDGRHRRRIVAQTFFVGSRYVVHGQTKLDLADMVARPRHLKLNHSLPGAHDA